MIVVARPSPNHNARPAGRGPDLVVMHGTAGKTDAGDLAWLTDPASRVSYHYLVGRDGAIYQLVAESRRAWHAGASRWQGRENVNDYSIGIALCNRGPEPEPEPYTDAQYHSAATVVADIKLRRGIGLDRVVGHVDVAMPRGRKQDPWGHFDWPRLRVEVINLLHPPPDPLSFRIPRAA